MSDRATAIAFVLLVFLALGGVIAALVGFQRASFADVTADGPPANCQEWSDGCHVCRRGEAGLSCSTPGIACVRSAPICLAPTN